ncbi:MAG: sugar transferase [bacterium]
MITIIRNIINFIFALFLFIILLPFIIIITFIIKIDSKGQAIFKQKRVGKYGKVFILYKFRTMRIDVDPNEQSPQNKNDSRITSFGKFLRESSLDELPQLINVIKRDMNLVGPRPLLSWQADEFSAYESRRLEVKPGITGLAQINGRGSLNWEEKIKYDIKYVENRNLMLDLKILLKTIKNVLAQDDIYEGDEGGWKTHGK